MAKISKPLCMAPVLVQIYRSICLMNSAHTGSLYYNETHPVKTLRQYATTKTVRSAKQTLMIPFKDTIPLAALL